MRVGRPSAAGIAGLFLVLGLTACASAPSTVTPGYRAVNLQPGDSIKVDDATQDVTLEVTSERGIGKVDIVRTGSPPKTLTINFHLKGLEELRWSWGDTTLIAHVSSNDGGVREEVIQNGGQPVPVDSTSPYWAPVAIEGSNPKIPLQDGFFAVTAPPAFLQAAPQRFSLQWIDFYR